MLSAGAGRKDKEKKNTSRVVEVVPGPQSRRLSTALFLPRFQEREREILFHQHSLRSFLFFPSSFEGGSRRGRAAPLPPLLAWRVNHFKTRNTPTASRVYDSILPGSLINWNAPTIKLFQPHYERDQLKTYTAAQPQTGFSLSAWYVIDRARKKLMEFKFFSSSYRRIYAARAGAGNRFSHRQFIRPLIIPPSVSVVFKWGNPDDD